MDYECKTKRKILPIGSSHCVVIPKTYIALMKLSTGDDLTIKLYKTLKGYELRIR